MKLYVQQILAGFVLSLCLVAFSCSGAQEDPTKLPTYQDMTDPANIPSTDPQTMGQEEDN